MVLSQSPHKPSDNNPFTDPFLIVSSLLTEGADPNITRLDGHTPLLQAFNYRHSNATIGLLLERKANPNAVWPQREEYNEETKKKVIVGDGEAPLHKAIRANNAIAVDKLLSHKADPNQPIPNGDRPLHLAVQYRSANIAELLLKRGAQVNLTGRKNRTALHYAINGLASTMDYDFDLEELLISHGADINARDAKMRTPFHYNFVKMGKNSFTDSKEHDPIEATTTLCSYKSTLFYSPLYPNALITVCTCEFLNFS